MILIRCDVNGCDTTAEAELDSYNMPRIPRGWVELTVYTPGPQPFDTLAMLKGVAERIGDAGGTANPAVAAIEAMTLPPVVIPPPVIHKRIMCSNHTLPAFKGSAAAMKYSEE